MKFHTTAVIRGHDPEGARRAILRGLQNLAIEINSVEDHMILHGLGPGRVSMNYEDFAILTIDQQVDTLFIEVVGAFDGIYLEDPEAQEYAVCLKLEEVFESVQCQIDSKQESSTEKPVKPLVKTVLKPGVAPIAEAIAEAARVSDDSSLFEHGRTRRAVHAVRGEAPIRDFVSLALAGFRKFGVVAAAFAGLVVVLLGVGGTLRDIRAPKGGDATVGGNLAVGGHSSAKRPEAFAAIGSGANQRPGPPEYGKNDDLAGATQPAREVAQKQTGTADLTILLKHWEASMRTRNAIEQSSFYSDPVDRYDGVNDLNWAKLEQKKEAAIASRKGLWTVKLEQIEIEKQTIDDAQIRLIQHVIDQPAPSHISEQFVRTDLELRRVHGAWKIVSEEDVAEPPDPRS